MRRRKFSPFRTMPDKLVDALNANRLNNPQMRIILEQLGASYAGKVAERRERLLEQATNVQPDRAQQIYEAVILVKPAAVANVESMPEEVAKAVTAAKETVLASISEFNSEKVEETLKSVVGNIEQAVLKAVLPMAKEAVTKAAENYRPVVIKQGSKTTKVKGVLPECFERIVELGSQRKPVMLVGPAGCGKTYLAAKLAEALKLPFFDQSCSEGISESTFMGWLLPVGESGKFSYVPAPFIQAYEKGGVFLLDEIDAADSNLLTFLNKAIANDSFFLPQRFDKPEVKKHKDFVVIAAANTFGTGADAEYVGRNALDAATLDRFRAGMIFVDYSRTVEEAIVEPAVLTWGLAIRNLIQQHKLRRVLSTRVMRDMSDMARNCNWKKSQWNEAYFADWKLDELELARRSLPEVFA